MTDETPPSGRLLERPGRVAAIGGAAVVCALSLSGALGLSSAGPSTDAPRHQVVSTGPAASSEDSGAGTTAIGGGSQDRTGTGGTSGTGEDSSAPAKDTSGSSTGSVALPAHSGTGKRVVFDVSAQRVWLVNADDSVERTYLVSGSKYDNLDLGTYSVYSRSVDATAYNSNETMRYMVRFAQGSTAAIGFHSVPARPDGTLVESRSQLGTPRSDGCIRQWITDARALWRFAPSGTTVVVRA